MFDHSNSGTLRNVISFVFDNKLVELEQYVSIVNDALMGKLEELGRDFDEKTKGLTDGERSWYAWWDGDLESRLASDFPALMWQTAFIHLYVILEHSLLDLCKKIRDANGITDAVTGQHKGIKAAQKFMTAAGLKFPIEGKVHGPVWRDCQNMNELRNIFIHRMGQIFDEPSDELKQYIDRKKGMIGIDSLGRITVNEQYCREAIEIVRTFFNAVLGAVPDDKLP